MRTSFLQACVGAVSLTLTAPVLTASAEPGAERSSSGHLLTRRLDLFPTGCFVFGEEVLPGDSEPTTLGIPFGQGIPTCAVTLCAFGSRCVDTCEGARCVADPESPVFLPFEGAQVLSPELLSNVAGGVTEGGCVEIPQLLKLPMSRS